MKNIAQLSDMQRDIETEEYSQDLYSLKEQKKYDKIYTYESAIYYLEEIKNDLIEVECSLEVLNQCEEAKMCKSFKELVATMIDNLTTDKKELENGLSGIL